MKLFKKFTDFCGGFAAASAIIYLFCQFMLFSPREELSILGKIKLFLGDGTLRDYRAYLLLVILLALSLLGGLIFKKYPALSFGLSLLPLVRVISMVSEGRFYERPMLYLILTLIYAVGGLANAIGADREEAGVRGAKGADLASLVTAGVAIYIPFRIESLTSIPEEEAKLDFFDALIRNLGMSAEAEGVAPDLSFFITVAILLLLPVLVSLLLRDLHFITASLSLIPLGYTLFHWLGGGIPVHGNLIAIMVLFTTACRFAVMLCCPAFLGKKGCKENS